MATVNRNGANIYYEVHGEGEPALLCLSAWCMSHNGFADLIAKCATKRKVIAVDWRGHGQSDRPKEDFGAADLVEDALAIIAAAGVNQVIPVTMSHAGWVGAELRNRLGERVPKLIVTDWLVLPPPPPYMDLVHGLASAEGWEKARDVLFNIWLENVNNDRLIHFVRDEMGSYDADTWMRSGREIGGCYERGGYPLKALASLNPPVPTLHIYSQPGDDDYLGAQQAFAKENPWYHIHRLAAHSHFPTFEVSDEIAATIDSFVAGNGS